MISSVYNSSVSPLNGKIISLVVDIKNPRYHMISTASTLVLRTSAAAIKDCLDERVCTYRLRFARPQRDPVIKLSVDSLR
jgi:hypothetical protein